MAPGMQFPVCLRAGAKRPGCNLTTLFGTNALPIVTTIEAPATPKKRSWLPVLVVLFLISYSLMTMLIVEQGRTIESQRTLIFELFGDSKELSVMKMKANIQHTQAAQAQSALTQAPSSHSPSSQNPSSQSRPTQNPSTQAPVKQAPSSQAARRAQNQAAKPFQMPSRPALDLADSKRALITI
jgi:hypothetical protein